MGVLVGALTSYAATSAAERAKHRRAMATRWDERKLHACVEYAATVKEAHRAAKAVVLGAAVDPAELLAAMEAAESRRSIGFEVLALLAGPAAVGAAEVVNLALWRGLRAARAGVENEEDEEWADAARELVAGLGAFHRAARADLGIAG
ncbi:hypothetical protein [Kitasatospora sp. NPDC088134]|uniref:hypothetical protein n=1 Tax=Kitasatospora sp. NPDC088134 TaxID=3364071 RepID=UPI003827EFD5